MSETQKATLPQREAWEYCGVSRSGWFKLRAQGLLPLPIEIPHVGQRWRKADLDKWLASLKPSRKIRRSPRPAAEPAEPVAV